MAVTLQSLLGFPSADSIKAILLSYLTRDVFPVTDWEVGGVTRTLLETEADVLSDLVDAISIQVAGGFLDSASGDWLTFLAHHWYEIERAAATACRQTITLKCEAAAGPYTIIAGVHVFAALDGTRYAAATGGTVAGGGTLSIDVLAETPGASRGLVSSLVTQLPGVTVFTAGISTAGGVVLYGSNEESDISVALRCDARWPSLDVGDGTDRAVKWAYAGSAEVTRVRLDADLVIPGGVRVTLAGASGAVSSGAVTAVQAYLDRRTPITDHLIAQTAGTRTITAGGAVTVPLARLAQIQADADLAWNEYLAAAQIGSNVYLSRLVQAVMDAGAIDFAATLNGGTTNVSLVSTEVPVGPGSNLATLLTWGTI